MTISARSAAFATILLAWLPGCEEVAGPGGPQTDAAPGAAQVRTEMKDVERSDIFSARELALWDGRPSLGGIWVAHPDVKEPERAILRNETNGQSVAGALFRRERNNPGPRLQVSSDAAAALGMLAGQPIEMSVVVVRQEEIVIEPAPLPVSDEVLAEPAPGDTAAAVPEAEASDDAVAAAAVAAAAEAKPKKPGFWQMFRRKPAAEVATEADTAAIAADASVPAVETAPLDPVASTAAAAIARAEAGDKPVPRPERGGTASAVRNPYVQVGLFSVEENATAAASSLRQAGIIPAIETQEVNGKTFWRVIVGPMSSADDQAQILAQVRRLGYGDAFLSPN